MNAETQVICPLPQFKFGDLVRIKNEPFYNGTPGTVVDWKDLIDRTSDGLIILNIKYLVRISSIPYLGPQERWFLDWNLEPFKSEAR